MGGNRARGSWEQTQGQTQSQTQHKQRPQVPSHTHHLSHFTHIVICTGVEYWETKDIFNLLLIT